MTINVNLDPLSEGNTSWFASWLALFEMVDDLAGLQTIVIPVQHDPEAGVTFFDSFYAQENITIAKASIDFSALAPTGGALTCELLVDGVASGETFDLNDGTLQQLSTLSTALNVNQGQRVGLKWTVVPGQPGIPGIIILYFKPRPIP